METAKLFKEKLEIGQISCVIALGTELVSIESPVILQPEIVKEEETLITNENIAKTLGFLTIGMVAQAFGASPESMQNLNVPALKSSKIRNVVQPELKAEGTRYHFQASLDDIVFLDNNKKAVKNIKVNYLDNFLMVDSIEQTAQEGVRVLKSGDQIVAIAGMPVYDTRGLRAVVSSFTSGQTYEITYYPSSSQQTLVLTAQGGEFLGIKFK